VAEDSCIIRFMEDRDLPQIAAIERGIFTTPWSEEGFRAAIQMPDNIYLTAEQDPGKVVGYCGMYVSPGEGEIVNVAVAPGSRRRGIAKRLLTCLLSESAKRGIHSCLLEVRKSNAGAIALYEKMGFKSLGIRKNFYESPREDALIMARTEVQENELRQEE